MISALIHTKNYNMYVEYDTKKCCVGGELCGLHWEVIIEGEIGPLVRWERKYLRKIGYAHQQKSRKNNRSFAKGDLLFPDSISVLVKMMMKANNNTNRLRTNHAE